MGELEDGEGVLVRLDGHLHEADQLARHAGRAVDTVNEWAWFVRQWQG